LLSEQATAGGKGAITLGTNGEKVMKRAIAKAFLLSSASLCIAHASPVLAQDAAPAVAQADDDTTIFVNARRTEERLQDVPISITVFNEEQIANRNIVNPSDLATYTPSLSANRQYGTEKSSFSIRGFTQELGTQPSVGVYFADVVAPRAQGPTTSGNGTMPGTLFDLQNVQVLKGPQGTLFGRNTTGGAILLVPRRPTDSLEGYVEGSVGNYDMRRFQAVLNAPLAETFKVRLGVDRMVREGYLRNRSGIGPDDFADVNYWSVRGSVLGELTPTLENYIVATYNQSNTHGTLPRVIACARDLATRLFTQVIGQEACAQIDRQTARGDGYYDVENSVPDPQVNMQQFQVINTTTWDASDTLTIKNIISYAEFRERTRINLVGDRLAVSPFTQIVTPPELGGLRLTIPTPAFLVGQPFTLATIEPGPSKYNAAQYTFTEELQFQGRSADDRLNWQAGGYFELSRPLRPSTQYSSLFATCADAAALQCSTPLAVLQLGGSLSLIEQRYKFRNIGAYAQATYDITEQLSATGGIRYTWDTVDARSNNVQVRFPLFQAPTFICTESGIPLTSVLERGRCTKQFEQKSSRPTWLLNLDYKPNDDTLLYAKWARGYRQGTVNLLPLGSSLVLTDPEKVDTYEVGAKLSFDGAVRGFFNVAAYYNDFRNQQLQANTIVRSLNVFPVNVIVNAGKSRIMGVEVDASARLFEGFQLDLAYGYLDSKLQSLTLPNLAGDPNYSGVIPTAQLGGPLVYSPKHRLTATGTYTLPLDESMGRLSIAATFTHTAEQFASHADDPFVAQIGFNPGILPATNLLNLNLNWDSVAGQPIDLSLFATNVTKVKHHLAIFGTYGAGIESIVVGEPRMLGARLRFRFGE
jgi:iron complex outermembrane recepter protein